MERSGAEQERSGGVERSGADEAEWSGVERSGAEWSGVERSGAEWSGGAKRSCAQPVHSFPLNPRTLSNLDV